MMRSNDDYGTGLALMVIGVALFVIVSLWTLSLYVEPNNDLTKTKAVLLEE